MKLPWPWRRDEPEQLDCHEVARNLQQHLDDELDQATARQVAAHLDDCRRCGLEAETYRQLKQRLSRFSGQVEPQAVERLRAFVDELTDHADA